MGKVLVTGALGNVGAYVAQYLQTNNQSIVAAGTREEALKSQFAASYALLDFTREATFAQSLENVDRVFLMRPPHLGRPEDLKPFIDAMKEKGGIRLVCFLSLLGVEKNPFPPHQKIEKYIEEAGLPFCHIRPSFFMQNLSGIHAFEIRYFDRIVVPVKNALTSFIDAEDIGEIVAHVMSSPESHQNNAYSITGVEALDYEQVAKILSDELARSIVYANPSSSLAKKYWIEIRGIEKDYATVMGMLYWMTRAGTAKRVTGTFRDVMGKEPQTFREFVRKNLSAWQR